MADYSITVFAAGNDFSNILIPYLSEKKSTLKCLMVFWLHAAVLDCICEFDTTRDTEVSKEEHFKPIWK